VATYNDDPNYGPAAPSPPLVQPVGKATPVFSPLQSNNPNATLGQPITFTATLTGVPGYPQPTGNVVFTDTYMGTPTVICTSALTQNGTMNSTATCTPSPTMLAGSHSIVATYTDNIDYGPAAPSSPFVQTVQKATPTTSKFTSNLNPSVQGQSVIFTAPVTGVSGGLAPTGGVTFTYTNNGGNGSPISECPNPVPLASNQATCTTETLASGLDAVTAAYGGDNNYTVSAPSLPQIVQDFTFGGLPSLLTVIQGSDNNGGPYPQPASVTLSPLPPYPYNGTVMLTACSVSPMLANAPTCILSPTSIPQGTGTASVTITTVGSTPIGPYNVMITGQDGGSAKSVVLPISVAYYSSTLPVTSGQPGIVAVPFVGSSGVNVNFGCSQVTGPQGTQSYFGNNYNIGCTVSPAMALLSTDRNNPTSVTVTITSSTLNAQLIVPGRILATIWLGMPAIVLVGSLRFGKLSRKKVLQLLGMLLVLVALLQGIGCGGGFTRPPSNTPAGFYSVLVVGQDSSGVQASAVIPFKVVGGN
jgi:Bacterial Ig-like domain (group 3)